MTRAGRLNKRGELFRPAATSADDFGQAGDAAESLGLVFFGLRPLSGREVEIGKQLRGDVSHEVTLRYDPGRVPAPTWWLVFNGRRVDFKAILNVDERDRVLTIVACEVPAV